MKVDKNKIEKLDSEFKRIKEHYKWLQNETSPTDEESDIFTTLELQEYEISYKEFKDNNNLSDEEMSDVMENIDI